jgi:hypothetical protein
MKVIKMKIPVIKGDIEVIPFVLEAFSQVPSGDKKVIRQILRDKFAEKFVIDVKGKKFTRKNRKLESDDKVKEYIDKTWLDCYALPMCERFRIIFRDDKYLLTAYGEKLYYALKRDYNDYLDMLAHFLIKQDREEWGILDLLLNVGAVDIETLVSMLKSRGIHIIKTAHVVNLLKIFKKIGLVSFKEGKYSINKERFMDLSSRKYFRGYDEVSDHEFFEALYDIYIQITKQKRSDYVEIDLLRGPVCQKLNWPWEYFDKRLAEMPLVMGNKQILFSPAAFMRRGGIYRMGQYYIYLSIYNKEGEIHESKKIK